MLGIIAGLIGLKRFSYLLYIAIYEYMYDFRKENSFNIILIGIVVNINISKYIHNMNLWDSISLSTSR